MTTIRPQASHNRTAPYDLLSQLSVRTGQPAFFSA
jgi:hypothetical protein